MSLLKKLIASFENAPGGFSARKLTAFAFTVSALYLQWKHSTPDNVPTLVLIDASTALLSLGIVTMAELVKLRHGGKE
jgi:hypothetical protein